jgi:hypothetical protein
MRDRMVAQIGRIVLEQITNDLEIADEEVQKKLQEFDAYLAREEDKEDEDEDEDL